VSWLLPKLTPPKGKVRTIGEADGKQLAAERRRRWFLSPKGRAYYLKRRQDPAYRQQQQERRKRWLAGPKGKAWLEANREKRNYYFRMRYHANPDRREYLNEKQRQYRAAKKQQITNWAPISRLPRGLSTGEVKCQNQDLNMEKFSE